MGALQVQLKLEFLGGRQGQATAPKQSRAMIPRIQALLGQIDESMYDLYDPAGDADRAAYSALVNLKEQAMSLAADVNREAATLKGVVRAGAGGRPDANAENAINQSVGGLGLTNQESQFGTGFVQNQGGGWKEQREALSAIWAKRAGLFQSLTPGKQQSGPDIEYRTTDPGQPQYWDQKTMYTGPEGFDGRLMETHGKVADQNGRGWGSSSTAPSRAPITTKRTGSASICSSSLDSCHRKQSRKSAPPTRPPCGQRSTS